MRAGKRTAWNVAANKSDRGCVVEESWWGEEMEMFARIHSHRND